mmetsp:Transcript_700/g.1622  ORF Transcript_700/g.1622 Transcript_700/m.1622 type:complete len:153 (-) Transcript_700:620-1078(-)
MTLTISHSSIALASLLCLQIDAFATVKSSQTLPSPVPPSFTRSTPTSQHTLTQQLLRRHAQSTTHLQMALGDYTLHLQKPLGIILQERNNGASGVRVKELVEGGAASASTDIVAGDVLLQINEVDVSSLDFDTIMDMLISLDPKECTQTTQE